MAFFTQSKAVRYLLGISGQTILALGLWLLLLATNPGRNETIDVGARLAVTRQLWTAGKVAVRHRPHGTEDLWIEIAPDRYVAPYGIGQSLVFVPFDMVSSVLEHFTPEAWRGQLPWLPIGFGLLPLLGLGYWYALRGLLQEWGFIHPWPTLGALAMMLGTIMFFYAGQAQEENLVGLCLTLAMLFALRLRRRPIWNNALAAGFFAGACPNNPPGFCVRASNHSCTNLHTRGKLDYAVSVHRYNGSGHRGRCIHRSLVQLCAIRECIHGWAGSVGFYV